MLEPTSVRKQAMAFFCSFACVEYLLSRNF